MNIPWTAANDQPCGPPDAVPLVETLMRIALEHAGAQRGLLIRVQGGTHLIEASATSSGGGVEVDMQHAAAGARDLPLTMLYTVMRTRMPLSVGDGTRTALYARDPYLAACPDCAALVIPMMKRTQLIGMLYLESRMAPHGFTDEHTQVLLLLAAQAAVSLETAQLYADLVRENCERRRVEKALRESRATLLLGERINQSGSWTWELERGLINCSAEFCRIFGFDPASPQVAFDTLVSHIHPPDRAKVLNLIGDAVAQRKEVCFEHRITGPDGTLRYLSVVGQPMGEGDSDIYVGTVSDITRRKADDEALRKAQAELARGACVTRIGQLTSAIAHEVNQPLMSISSNAGAGLRWLQRDPPRLDRVGDMLQDIVGQSQRAGKIIHTLQALAHRSPHFGPLDLHVLVRRIVALARTQVDQHEVRLILSLEAADPFIEGDADQLQQVFLNLIGNACDALDQLRGRERLLQVSSRGWVDEGILVEVEDNGIGTDGLDLEKLFEPFTGNKPDGMGMGLAICRSIVESHGGWIRAERGQKHGCRIAFFLPKRAGMDGAAA